MGRARYETNKGFYLELGKRVAKARGSRMTQDTLAKKLNLTRTSIINIEKGRQQVLVHTLVDIARYLGITIGSLIPQSDLNALLRDASEKGRAWVLSSAVSANKDD